MSDLFGRILLLKRSPLFTQVETDELRAVAAELEEELYMTGERIFDINEQGDHAYFLESGKVGISILPDPKRREFVAILGPGDVFGDMNLFDQLPRSGTAHVLEESRVLSLDQGKMRGLIVSYPELGLGLLHGLSLRLRAMNKLSATFQDIDSGTADSKP
jgi:CRP-like cAMP-binding protein